jgi:lysophospholipase L1-like esterase
MDIISYSKVKKLETQLADIANDTSFYATDLLFLASWNGYLSGSQFEFYVSNDGVKFKNINKSSVFKSLSGDALDYHMFYKDGYFYVLYDIANTLRFAKSSDLVTWTETTIPITGFVRQWASKWFKDDSGDVYLFATLAPSFVSENDIDGTSIAKLDLYSMKATDGTLASYTTPVLLNLPDHANRIDPFVIKRNGTYHLFCKNDYNKTIEHYTNTTLDNTVTWTLLQTESFPFRVEGIAVTYFNGLYYMYADVYNSGFTLYKTSVDLTTWSAAKIAGAESGATTRHFAPMVVSDTTIKTVIKNFAIKQQKIATDSVSSLYVKNNARIDNSKINIASSGSVTLSSLLAIPKKTYIVSGSGNATINSFDISCLKNGDEFYLSVQSGSASAGITIKHGGSSIMPSDVDYGISQAKGNSETVITLICDGSSIRVKNNQNVDYQMKSMTDEFTSRTAGKNVDLATLAVGGVINSLTVESDTLYYTTATSGDITINNLNIASLPRFSQIYFSKWAPTTATSRIIIKPSATMLTPKGKDIIINDSDLVYKFIKTNSVGFRSMTTLMKNAEVVSYLGDSVTNKVGTTKAYWEYIQEDTGYISNNYGVNGTCVSSGGADPTNAFINRYPSISSLSTVIAIFGGQNDYSSSVPLGTISSTDSATFYGAYNNLLNGLINTYPNARIICLTPLRRFYSGVSGDTANSAGATLGQYAQAVKEVAAKYAVPVVDLYTESGLRPENNTQLTTYMPDGIHPNANGHKRFYKPVLNKIQSV